ncbi:ER membrane protein complex subunit 2-like [Mercenaria mercenaria]|uniref:ER membrane protein complex subunit 2-like n=1 Tax=Mercenaria mercenaria TaxID=6596 RepID=UPI00234F8B4F|nr:ER membrane protein complex subunit 2-like [Mercenaria mercenaria]
MSRQINWEEARDALRKIREEQIRDGARVVRLWKQVLANCAHKLGDEVWTVQEQVTVAALDCQNFDMANECITSLNRKFPNSMRVRRLFGMYFEALGRYEKATEQYEKILEEDSTNMFARKRQIAILKEKNDVLGAIESLNKYLEMFMTDFDAWMELCDLYLLFQDYNKAAFCMEELIMSNPHNHLYHQKFAEIKYTQGGSENLETARSYFAQACKLNPNNMRAQFGLLLTASNLATGHSKNQKEKNSNSKYAVWAAEQIIDKYQTTQTEEQLKDTKVLDLIKKMQENLVPQSET